MSGTVKISDETYQVLLRYEIETNTKVRLHHCRNDGNADTLPQQMNREALASVSGTTAKAIWHKFDRAKKALNAGGVDVDSPGKGKGKATIAKAAPKKRAAKGKKKANKDEDLDGDTEVEDAGEDGGDDEEQYGRGMKRFKREDSVGGMPVFGGKSEGEEDDE
jgi:hypothetical protein